MVRYEKGEGEYGSRRLKMALKDKRVMVLVSLLIRFTSRPPDIPVIASSQPFISPLIEEVRWY
jgi:hypothetical protein